MNHRNQIKLFLKSELGYHKTSFKRMTVVFLFWNHSEIKTKMPSV